MFPDIQNLGAEQIFQQHMIGSMAKSVWLRISRQNESAMKIANYLNGHSKVSQVFYPGLETHTAHAITKSQMRGFGGMLLGIPESLIRYSVGIESVDDLLFDIEQALKKI